MKRFVFIVLQIVWGLPQTLLGLAVFAWARIRKSTHFLFRGTVVVRWHRQANMSLGPFLFIGERMLRQPGDTGFEKTSFSRMLVHEYGHAVQSAILGPFYLLLIGLPSAIWANSQRCAQYRTRMRMSYYDLLPEASANRLGERVLRLPAM